MENILNFLADNYLYFMIGAVVLLFALIGFAVDGKKKKKTDDVNPMPQVPNQAMQFGQNPNMPQNQAANNPEPVQNQAPETNGMTTGFSEFSTQANMMNQTPVSEPSIDNLNSNQTPNETLTFGPISSNDNESIFTEPPVVDNQNNETLTFETPSTEPTMEALDLGVPQANETPSEPMPVSMTPEVPVQNEVSAPTPEVPVQETQAPEMPSLNNTIQQ